MATHLLSWLRKETPSRQTQQSTVRCLTCLRKVICLIMSQVIQTITSTTIESTKTSATPSTMRQLATLFSSTTNQNPIITEVNTTIMSAVNLNHSITNNTTMHQRLISTTHTLCIHQSCPVNGSFIEMSEMTRTMRTTRKISIIVMDTPMAQLHHRSSKSRPKRTQNMNHLYRKSKCRNLKQISNQRKEVHLTSFKV